LQTATHVFVDVINAVLLCLSYISDTPSIIIVASTQARLHICAAVDADFVVIVVFKLGYGAQRHRGTIRSERGANRAQGDGGVVDGIPYALLVAAGNRVAKGLNARAEVLQWVCQLRLTDPAADVNALLIDLGGCISKSPRVARKTLGRNRRD
jgi:hypothetical protein